ncbi:hypothetical protein [Micromonospora sagamiensis]|uniref:hypothetical protein n=1 Tax=Micromonospora sagamiensis TaxID=47875 RepID=UPI0011A2A335|nr:hypothetical protein [Micromonospora sagamiensis]BCL13962.1 hypothetical protein GCM10017556_17010 [Micromonospora sagamiensis]
MDSVIFQPSDLANQRRVEFLDAARSGRARLRDKDGTSLVMLPERHLVWLEAIAKWSSVHLRLEELLRRGAMPAVAELGDLAWLRAFDMDDLREFVGELHEALVVTNSDQDPSRLDECVHAWKTTARQLEDPLRRKVLLGGHALDEYEEVRRPDSNGGDS